MTPADPKENHMLEEKAARELCNQVLKRCEGEGVEVLLQAQDSALTRFANNTIHQNVAERDTCLLVRMIAGLRTGTATTNRLEAGALDEVVAHAHANALVSPEDPDSAGLAGPAAYTRVEAFDPQTAGYPAEARARAVGLVCRMAGEKGLNASGAFTTGTQAVALANSEGLFAYQASTRAGFQTVVLAEDASGRARADSWRVSDLPVEALGGEALSKAERGRAPRPPKPGEYAVVFDPYVTHDLLSILNIHGMSAQAVQEGRSWMNDRLGQPVMSPQVSIWDDGLDPEGLPMPFDFEGTPKQRVDIVRAGVAVAPVYDRLTAQKAQRASTGHGLPPDFRMYGPLAANLFMASGEASVEEMIRSTTRGLYINRFWYTRLVHPRDCIVTGMTRDGVFLIDHGELAYPVKNLRFTQSYVKALAAVEAISRDSLLLTNDYTGFATRVPALKIGRFNFTGTTQ